MLLLLLWLLHKVLNMGAVATPAVPSSSNIKGGLAGLAATLAVGYLTHAGYLAIAASFLALPVPTVAVAITGIIGTLANVAITHISELKTADAILKSIQSIKVEYNYPEEKSNFTSPPSTSSNGT